MSRIYIQKLINQGEGQLLDFKFEISDARKIARSFAAFANSDGGKLLVGVKDNGVIAGVRSEEEFYMLESAAGLNCRPEVPFLITNHNIDGKVVLEVDIPKSDNKPHYARNEDGIWLVYIRKNDQNLLANAMLMRIWKRQKKKRGTYLKYTATEKQLFEYLIKHDVITLKGFIKLASIPKKAAENVLVNLILLNVIEMEITEKETYFQLMPDFNFDELDF